MCRGGIVALLGANGAARRRRSRRSPTSLHAERGEVTKGTIEFRGRAQVQTLSPERSGAARLHSGDGGPALLRPSHHRGKPADRRLHAARRQGRDQCATWRVYQYFPRLKERRASQAGYTSGGEQQMCAIGRALMSRPKMILLDEPSMGLAPQIVEEIFEIVHKLNEEQGVSFLLAEQNTNMALRYAKYGYIMESGRIVLDGEASRCAKTRT
jgi:branched-chain amino acid transport system ATP-binding protein